ncbi:hypothetical protein HPB50_027798 [Hyalomma asiaticum]|nr:hypothetical protein HPB50_027798 [Hyalomma asiaticum]
MNRAITRPQHAITTALINAHATFVHEDLTQRTSSKGRSFRYSQPAPEVEHYQPEVRPLPVCYRCGTPGHVARYCSRRRAPSYGQAMSSARPGGRYFNTLWLGNSTSEGRFREERRRSPALESYSREERPRNR